MVQEDLLQFLSPVHCLQVIEAEIAAVLDITSSLASLGKESGCRLQVSSPLGVLLGSMGSLSELIATTGITGLGLWVSQVIMAPAVVLQLGHTFHS